MHLPLKAFSVSKIWCSKWKKNRLSPPNRIKNNFVIGPMVIQICIKNPDSTFNTIRHHFEIIFICCSTKWRIFGRVFAIMHYDLQETELRSKRLKYISPMSDRRRLGFEMLENFLIYYLYLIVGNLNKIFSFEFRLLPFLL